MGDGLILATFINAFFYYLIYIPTTLYARAIRFYSLEEPRLIFLGTYSYVGDMLLAYTLL